MNITKNQIDDLNLQVTIDITPEDYAAAEKKRLNERKRTADFKGFRRGMAPMSLIQRVYGEQALYESVNQVVSDALNKVIDEDKIRVIGEPLASEDQPELEWKSGNDFTFKFDIASSPEIVLDPGKDDKIPYYNISVTAVAKKEMKDNMLHQAGSLQEGEKAGEEDFVIADLSNESKSVDGAYIAVRNVEGEAHALFVGCKSGDKFDINVNEAFTNETDRSSMLKVKKEELATLDPVFHVSVVNVKTYVPAAENQETYDKLFGEDKVHNSEEFDKAVEENLASNYRHEADYRLSKDIRDYLVSKADVKLPEAFLRRWLIRVNEGKYTAEDIDKEFPAFIADYKWQLVRSALMQKFGLKVEENDLQEAAKAYVAYQYAMYGMGNVPDQFLTEGAANVLQDENQFRRIVDNVEDQKVIAAVREAVTLQSKKISVEKFRELK